MTTTMLRLPASAVAMANTHPKQHHRWVASTVHLVSRIWTGPKPLVVHVQGAHTQTLLQRLVSSALLDKATKIAMQALHALHACQEHTHRRPHSVQVVASAVQQAIPMTTPILPHHATEYRLNVQPAPTPPSVLMSALSVSLARPTWIQTLRHHASNAWLGPTLQ